MNRLQRRDDFTVNILADTFRLKRMEEELHPRYEHAAALHKNQIYVFGGADTSGNRNDLQKLNLGL